MTTRQLTLQHVKLSITTYFSVCKGERPAGLRSLCDMEMYSCVSPAYQWKLIPDFLIMFPIGNKTEQYGPQNGALGNPTARFRWDMTSGCQGKQHSLCLSDETQTKLKLPGRPTQHSPKVSCSTLSKAALGSRGTKIYKFLSSKFNLSLFTTFSGENTVTFHIRLKLCKNKFGGFFLTKARTGLKLFRTSRSRLHFLRFKNVSFQCTRKNTSEQMSEGLV